MKYLILTILIAGCSAFQSKKIVSGDAVVLQYDCIEKNDCSKVDKKEKCSPCKVLGPLRIYRNERS